MTKQEKVIKGLECCLPAHDPDCDLCPYDDIDLRCRAKLRDDIIAQLKAQEPRVLALDEIHSSMAVWLEDVDKADVMLAITESEFYALHGLVRCFITSDNRRIAPSKREYGIRWRAWTSEPTDEMRKAVKWNG